MELGTQFTVNEWDQFFSVDNILDDKVLPSAPVIGEDVKLGMPFNFDIDLASFDDDVNGSSHCVMQESESIQPTKMMSGSLPSKSPWHESDSGVSDTRSYAGSPLGNTMEEMSVDPDMILPPFVHHPVDSADIDGDLAAYLLGESNNFHTESGQTVSSAVETSEQNSSNSLVPGLSATGRPVRKCVSKKVNIEDDETSDSECSVTDDTHSTTCKSKSQADTVNFFKDPSTFNTGGDIKIVRVLKPPAGAADATADDIMKALEERSKKNARQAKINREKKKVYIQGLESDLENLKKENRDLQSENSQMKSEMSNLEEEVQYLKSVLANASALSGLLKNISNVKEVKLSANITSRKRSSDDHSYNMVESRPQKRARMVSENLKKAGVCLHVSDGEACLEFCAHCASLASKTHGRGGTS